MFSLNHEDVGFEVVYTDSIQGYSYSRQKYLSLIITFDFNIVEKWKRWLKMGVLAGHMNV